MSIFEKFGMGGNRDTAVSDAKKEKIDYDNKPKVQLTDEQRVVHKNEQATEIFKSALSGMQGAIERATKALKDFRPDIDLSPISSSGIKIVKKNFKEETIHLLTNPTLKTSGFHGVKKITDDILTALEGNLTIDLSGVTAENEQDAFENLNHYKNKVDALLKQVKLLDNVIDSTVLKFKELKQSGQVDALEEKFDLRAMEDSKKVITDIKQQVNNRMMDISEGLTMLNGKTKKDFVFYQTEINMPKM